MFKPTTNSRVWRFFRAGGIDQVRLDRGSDIVALEELDQKLWVALACPARGLHYDARTLALIDSDNDGRVRAGELLAAVKWTCGLIRNPDDLLKRSPALALDAIADTSPEGRKIRDCASEALGWIGKSGAGQISLEDIEAAVKAFDARPFNGDGVLVESALGDDAARAAFADIVSCVGSDTDRSGVAGLSAARIQMFFESATKYLAWHSSAGTAEQFLGSGSCDAAAAVRAIRAKLDDFFVRCRLAAFDERAGTALNRSEAEYQALGAKDLCEHSGELAALPVARVGALARLDFDKGLNPAWSAAVARLRDTVVMPLLGERSSLSEQEWRTVVETCAPYEQWLARKEGVELEKLGPERVRQMVDADIRQRLLALVAQDDAQKSAVETLRQVEKLVRLYRDLHLLLINFVNFRDFYDGGAPAIFQAGRLFLDQRTCDLCLVVDDVGRHATMAGLAGTYLAYCDCVRRGGTQKMQIVAAFTDGDSDNLMVGRNGVFYDRAGDDWDATITRIVDNPISLRQAFWAPYKKLVRMIEEQIARRAAAAEASSTAKLQNVASTTATLDKAKVAEPRKMDVGTVAAVGVAFGAIGTFFATLLGYVTGIIKLGPLAIVAALIGVLVLISGPSMILAFIKLRKRNLGPILDACGWAVNAKAHLSVRFGAVLTQVARLPSGAQRELRDPYADKKSAWPKVFAAAFVLYLAWTMLNHMGFIYDWTDGRLGKQRILKHEAPVMQVVPGP